MSFIDMQSEMLITATFKGEPGKQTFKGSRQELLDNIATTYSRVPHGVTQQSWSADGTVYQVKVSGETIAHFTCLPAAAFVPLPGHF